MKRERIAWMLLVLALVTSSAVHAQSDEHFQSFQVHIPDGANTLLCQPLTLGQGTENGQ